ncbi:MAG TPA: ribbon-helix-helix protein, CopG family [Solirubrobacterales bacterium]|nr:ribbon-helix-helix protein, CopG family [Solirubrobacterales bacterium]
MSPNKAMSVRLPDSMNAQINALARIEGVHVSELVREAIEDYLSRRRSEKDLKERLKQRMEEDWKVLEHLGKKD